MPKRTIIIPKKSLIKKRWPDIDEREAKPVSSFTLRVLELLEEEHEARV